jgi:hypothetical protein
VNFGLISLAISQGFIPFLLPLMPRSAGAKELLNNFKILTEQGLCESLSYSWAYAKPKNRLIVIVNSAGIFF